jgi:hypothetical protein
MELGTTWEKVMALLYDEPTGVIIRPREVAIIAQIGTLQYIHHDK